MTRRGPTPNEKEFLFSRIGAAVWFIQHLEDALSTSITIKTDFKDAPLHSVSSDNAKKALTKKRKMTLGQAVGFSKEHAIYSNNLQQSLAEFLSERNWLIHRLVHENSDDMNVNGKREILLQRIASISERALILQKAVSSDLEDFLAAKGADRQRLHAYAQRAFLKGRGIV